VHTDKDDCKGYKLEDADVEPAYKTFNSQAFATPLLRCTASPFITRGSTFQIPTSTLQHCRRNFEAGDH
jgi:hypothetical protein